MLPRVFNRRDGQPLPREEEVTGGGLPTALADRSAAGPRLTFAERVVARLSGGDGEPPADPDVVAPEQRPGHNRRSFLTRVVVGASALSLDPFQFITRPASAYDVICGSGNTCGEGWSVFCCTINNGTNACPPGSFTAGWWKADNSSFCGGSARYYIDCNQSCSSPCSCYCPTGTCDNRRTCCNQFRYGQCNQQIACAGPVRCRMVSCTPPWVWDPSCTTSVATDNRTANHNAPCNNPAPPPPPPPPPGALGMPWQAARNVNGRLAAAAVAINGAAFVNTQTSPGGGWGGWVSLGGSLPFANVISIGTNHDGRLEVFALGNDKQIHHAWQATPGGAWSAMLPMGGSFAFGPTVGRNLDGRLELFAVGTNGQLYHSWQNAPGGSWSGWYSFGGTFTASVAVGANTDGRLEVVGVGSDKQLYGIKQVAPNGVWTGYYWVGGADMKGRPAMARNSDGRLELIGTRSTGAIVRARQSTAGGGWGPVTDMGGFTGFAPAIGRNADGRLEVFVTGTDQKPYRSFQGAPSGSWSGWVPFSGAFAKGPAVVSNADGRQELFGIGTDGAMYRIAQTAPNSGWGGFSSLGGWLVT
jgi:hypothetical protein